MTLEISEPNRVKSSPTCLFLVSTISWKSTQCLINHSEIYQPPARLTVNNLYRSIESPFMKSSTPALSSTRAKFIQKLHNAITVNHGPVVQWTTSQDSFVVLQPETFCAVVLPTFCRHTSFASFERQLHFYRYVPIVPNVSPLDFSGFLITTLFFFRIFPFLWFVNFFV